MPDVNPWIPVATAALGVVSTLATQIVTQWSTSRRERLARAHETEERRQRQRSEFERKTLLGLQAAALRLHRAVITLCLMKNFAGNAVDSSGKIVTRRRQQDAYSKVLGSVIVMTSRVQDNTIRDLSKQYRGEAFKALEAKTPQEAAVARAAIGEAFSRLNERIGVVLHDLC